MRILLLLSLFILASCAQTFKRHPLKGTEFVRRYVSCESERVHDRNKEKITSVLRYNYEAEEFRTAKAADGSYSVSYRLTFPGSKNSTSAFHAGIGRYGALVDNKQWLENKWFRTLVEKDDIEKLHATGTLSDRKVLRQLSSEEDYIELEGTESLDGKKFDVVDLWERKREKKSLYEYKDTMTARNPSEVEKDLLSWIVVCYEKLEHLQ